MSEQDTKQVAALSLPCLRGQVQDWIYYVTLMAYSEVACRFKPAEEIHKNATLNELLQRALTKRSAEIGTYIIEQKQHFFNAIIAGIYDGEPRWIEIDLPTGADNKPSAVAGSVGVLELSGDERVFAIDGQHRVEGIKNAVSRKPRHGDEEAVVIFVAHSNRPTGLERTRRLFSTLNRYAKPVDLGEIIALDEDDSIAIITRRLLYHHPLLSQKAVVAPSKTKNIPQSNCSALTSIQALYELLERVLLNAEGIQGKQLKEFKRLRKTPVEIDKLYEKACELINGIVSNFEDVGSYSVSREEKRAIPFRNTSGGCLLFRPVGLSILGQAIAIDHQKNGHSLSQTLKALRRTSMDLSEPPWAGLIFDAANGRMRPRISKTDTQISAQLWLVLAKLTDFATFPKLVKDYAGAIGVTHDDARTRIKAFMS